jgi:hypothetical protein
MSLTHLFIRHHTVSTTRGTGAQVVHYLERTHQYALKVKATVAYLDRLTRRLHVYHDRLNRLQRRLDACTREGHADGPRGYGPGTTRLEDTDGF